MTALPLKREVGLEASRSLPITWEHVMDEAEARYEDLCRRKAEAAPAERRRR